MASPSNNLFLRLHKWAVRQDENFLTESLAVVLEQLLVLAPEVGGAAGGTAHRRLHWSALRQCRCH